MAYSDFYVTSSPVKYDHVVASKQGEPVSLVEGFIPSQAGFAREGSDLVITGINEETLLVQGFYTEQPSGIEAGTGFMSYQMIDKLAGVLNPGEYAQATPFIGQDAIGLIETSEGSVSAVRADGTSVPLEAGSAVFQGDVIRTGDGSSVGITFKDDSTFSLDEKGEMTLDEMVYDPDTGDGAFSTSLTSGVFSFVSGQIAKANPDAMTITTPVATIGIRGTQGVVKQEAGGKLEAALLEEAGGFTGELILTNSGGTVILNQPNQFSAVLSFNTIPGQPITLNTVQISGSFGTKTIRVLHSARINATARKAAAAQEEALAKQAAAQEAEILAEQAKSDAEALVAEAEAAAEAAALAEGAEAEALLAEAEALLAEAQAAEAFALQAVAEAQALVLQAAETAAKAEAAAKEAALIVEAQQTFETNIAEIQNQINEFISATNQPTNPLADSPISDGSQNDVLVTQDEAVETFFQDLQELTLELIALEDTGLVEVSETKVVTEEDTSVTTTTTTTSTVSSAAPKYSLSFDGGDYIKTAVTSQVSAAFTIDLKINPTSTGDGVFKPLISKGNGAVGNINSNAEFNLQIQSTGNLNFFMGNGTGYGLLLDGGVLSANTDYHIVVTFNGTTGTLYLNGAQMATSTFTGTPVATTDPLEISHYYNTDQQYFKGEISDVRVWDSAITPADFGKTITGAETGLVSYMPLDSVDSTLGTTPDLVSSNSDAVLGATVVGDLAEPTLSVVDTSTNDTLFYHGDGTNTYDGGGGTDTLKFSTGGTFDPTNANFTHKISNIEILDFLNGNWNATLNKASVAAMSDGVQNFIVVGNAGDTLSSSETWTDSGVNQTLDLSGLGNKTYSKFDNGGYSIYVVDDVDTTNLVDSVGQR